MSIPKAGGFPPVDPRVPPPIPPRRKAEPPKINPLLKKGRPLYTAPSQPKQADISRRVAQHQDKIVITLPAEGLTSDNIKATIEQIVDSFSKGSLAAKGVFLNTIKDIYKDLDSKAEWNEVKVRSLFSTGAPKVQTKAEREAAHTIILNLRSKVENNLKYDKALIPFVLDLTEGWELGWNETDNKADITKFSIKLFKRMKELSTEDQMEFLETLQTFKKNENKISNPDAYRGFITPYLRNNSDEEFKKGLEIFKAIAF